MEISVAMAAQLHDQLCAHLLRKDGQEDLAFAFWYPSQGTRRLTILLHDFLEPQPGDRTVHGNASFNPSYFERAVRGACERGAGIAFLHSHGGPGWQGMSRDDVAAEERIAPATFGATDLPLVGLTLGTDGAWSARAWERVAPRRFRRRWASSVRVVGPGLDVTFCDELQPRPSPHRENERTVSAWGEEAQAKLARLRVGIVGAGSVGSIVAEALARTGVERITLIDFDTLEAINLDRTLHASREQAAAGRAKVDVVADGLRRGATAPNFEVTALPLSVVEEEGFRAALDCDVLFSCVDRPWPRHVLNFTAFAHLIPVVDGGIAVQVGRGRKLRSADWRAHVASPGRPCLECLSQYDSGHVDVERTGHLDDPSYIAGLPESHILRRRENVFAFSLAAASLEILQFLSMVVQPSGVSTPGAQNYHFVLGRLDVDPRCFCHEACAFPGLTARGDRAGLVVTAPHGAAEEARRRRSASRPPKTPPRRSRLREWVSAVAQAFRPSEQEN